jgi:hypothetical protein
MSVTKSKLVLISSLLLCGVPIYFSMPGGDRQFTIVVWLLFCAFVSALVLHIPVLHCPNCERSTKYFDNYREWHHWFTSDFGRHVKCAHCGCIIDRASGAGVGRIPRDEATIIDRHVFYFRWRIALYILGATLLICSVALGVLMLRIMREANANQQQGVHVLVGCGVVFLLGLALLATGLWLKRRASRFAEENDVELREGIRVRW